MRLELHVNRVFVHLIQLQRKPELKEVDIAYGKKVKDISCRGKTIKEDWKEKEASTTQTVPTRIKIFEGGLVKFIYTSFVNTGSAIVILLWL